MDDKQITEAIDTITGNQAAIINLVSALAQRLTGETPYLAILKKSELVDTKPSIALVRWAVEAQGYPCISQEQRTKP